MPSDSSRLVRGVESLRGQRRRVEPVGGEGAACPPHAAAVCAARYRLLRARSIGLARHGRRFHRGVAGPISHAHAGRAGGRRPVPALVAGGADRSTRGCAHRPSRRACALRPDRPVSRGARRRAGGCRPRLERVRRPRRADSGARALRPGADAPRARASGADGTGARAAGDASSLTSSPTSPAGAAASASGHTAFRPPGWRSPGRCRGAVLAAHGRSSPSSTGTCRASGRWRFQ